MINNRYIIKRKLGEGRSKVFSAIDTEFPDKEIAIKFLSVNAKPDEKDSFRDEFFRLKKLEHPNIIKAFEYSKVVTKDAEDLEIEFNSEFITLEYFPSKELLEFTELIEEKKLKEILKQLCAVLYYLHQSNYIYYDLKPENILVSNVLNKPKIKLIDFGLTEYQLQEVNVDVKGTAQYIAPELLKKEQHDHTVDFYSLGIILYRIVYGRFPFNASSEVEIYKAHIEQEFVFPPSRYSRQLISVIKKLVSKDPQLRYQDALEILRDLEVQIDLEVTKDFIPSKFFTNRKDAVNIIRSYIADTNSNEIYCVKGAEGSGKTSLLFEVYENYENAILVENYSSKSGFEAIKYIFKKILYSSVLFESYTKEQSLELGLLFSDDTEDFVQKLKVFTNSALKNSKALLLLDDFNLYDDFVKDAFKELFPVFQMNNVKIIISENANFPSATALYSNIREFQISHFTDSQLADFIEISYWQKFPKKELKKVVSLYSDLLPGNVKQFIKDLIVLGILDYSKEKITLELTEELEKALQSSSEEIYRIRLSNLSVEELKLAQLISAFEISIEQTVLAGLLNVTSEKLKELINGLEKKNIIDPLTLSNSPKVNSVSFKNYIYSTINSKSKYHLIIANTIKKLFPGFNLIELARQYELAGEFEKSAEVLRKEIELADRISAFAYKRSLLEKVLSFELNETTRQWFLIELIKTNYKLSDYKSILDEFDKINKDYLESDCRFELLFIKAVSLKNTQSINDAVKLFNELLNESEIKLKNKILFEFADIEFDAGNYEKSYSLCLEIKKYFSLLDGDDKGRLLNIMGLIEYNWNKNIDKAIELIAQSIQEFEINKSFGKIAGIYVNLGILNFEKQDIAICTKLFDKAIQLNDRLGNYEQKGLIQMNFGVMQMNLRNFEVALENFRSAKKTFYLLGSNYYYSLMLTNIGDTCINTSDYQTAYESLSEAKLLHNNSGNIEEELYVLFLLGKFWFVIGDRDELESVIKQYEYYSYAKSSFNDKHLKSYHYLKLLLKIFDDERINVDEVLKLMEETLTDEITQYADILFYCIEKMALDRFTSDSLMLLKTSLIREISEKFNYFDAYKDYILGKIVSEEKIEGYLSASEYFESAYKKIENDSITELTWKVLVAITELYCERGNYYKAKKPRLYAIELLNMIADSISNTRIRTRYLEKRERKEAIELLKKIGEQFRINEVHQS